MDKPKLYAGFFVGEFGWELMRWQGFLRHMSCSYDIVVGCEKDKTFLYQDFAHSFVIYPGKVNTRNMWLCNGKVFPLYSQIEKTDVEYYVPSKDICLNDNLNQDFIRYGQKAEENKYDIILHARSTGNIKSSYRNWPISKWDQLIELLKKKYNLRIACMGSKAGADYINGTTNLIGKPLEQIANDICRSRVFVSPSSGPVHFASLCGKQHIVWSDKKDRGIYKNKERYLDTWNPLKTKCKFIPKWQPSIYTVYEAIEETLNLRG